MEERNEIKLEEISKILYNNFDRIKHIQRTKTERRKEMADMDKLEEVYTDMEKLDVEELRQVIIHAEDMILRLKKKTKASYEDEFISLMLECGLDMLNARTNLIDFRAVATAYLQSETVYLEDLEYAVEVVLRKNGYTPSKEAKQLVNQFIKKTFGQNIPSMVGSMII